MENLARYSIRASFFQERMNCVTEEAKGMYQSKDGKEKRIVDTVEWLAAMASHVPNKGEQMVRYYGYYSLFFQVPMSDNSLYADARGLLSVPDLQVLGMGFDWFEIDSQFFS